jgi:hypothetical protein
MRYKEATAEILRQHHRLRVIEQEIETIKTTLADVVERARQQVQVRA